jgi:hypothetical protein
VIYNSTEEMWAMNFVYVGDLYNIVEGDVKEENVYMQIIII